MKRTFALGRYTCVERIDSGPLGETWRAKVYGIAGVERVYAVRRLRAQLTRDAALLEDLLTAARTYQGLEHEGLLPLHEISAKLPNPYLVYEDIAGIELTRLRSALLQHAPASGAPPLELLPDIVTLLGQELAETLAYAHQRNVLHLALHPQTLHIDDHGALHASDLGLLRPLLRGEWLEDPHLATLLACAAPEVLRGDPVDVRSDIFSLGAVLYEVLTGAPAFTGDSAQRVRAQVERGLRAPPAVVGLSGAVVEQLGQVLLKAVAARPGDRYPSMHDLVQALCSVPASRDEARSVLQALGQSLQGRLGQQDPLADAHAAPQSAASPRDGQPGADPLPPPPGQSPTDLRVFVPPPAELQVVMPRGMEPLRAEHRVPAPINLMPRGTPASSFSTEEEEHTVPVPGSPRSRIIVIEAESPGPHALPALSSLPDETPLPISVPLIGTNPGLEVTRVPGGAYPVSVPGWQGSGQSREPVPPSGPIGSGPLSLLGLDSGPTVLTEALEQHTRPERPGRRPEVSGPASRPAGAGILNAAPPSPRLLSGDAAPVSGSLPGGGGARRSVPVARILPGRAQQRPGRSVLHQEPGAPTEDAVELPPVPAAARRPTAEVWLSLLQENEEPPSLAAAVVQRDPNAPEHEPSGLLSQVLARTGPVLIERGPTHRPPGHADFEEPTALADYNSGGALAGLVGRTRPDHADRESRLGSAVVDRESRLGSAVVDRESRLGSAVANREPLRGASMNAPAAPDDALRPRAPTPQPTHHAEPLARLRPATPAPLPSRSEPAPRYRAPTPAPAADLGGLKAPTPAPRSSLLRAEEQPQGPLADAFAPLITGPVTRTPAADVATADLPPLPLSADLPPLPSAHAAAPPLIAPSMVALQPVSSQESSLVSPPARALAPSAVAIAPSDVSEPSFAFTAPVSLTVPEEQPVITVPDLPTVTVPASEPPVSASARAPATSSQSSAQISSASALGLEDLLSDSSSGGDEPARPAVPSTRSPSWVRSAPPPSPQDSRSPPTAAQGRAAALQTSGAQAISQPSAPSVYSPPLFASSARTPLPPGSLPPSAKSPSLFSASAAMMPERAPAESAHSPAPSPSSRSPISDTANSPPLFSAAAFTIPPSQPQAPSAVALTTDPSETDDWFTQFPPGESGIPNFSGPSLADHSTGEHSGAGLRLEHLRSAPMAPPPPMAFAPALPVPEHPSLGQRRGPVIMAAALLTITVAVGGALLGRHWLRKAMLSQATDTPGAGAGSTLGITPPKNPPAEVRPPTPIAAETPPAPQPAKLPTEQPVEAVKPPAEPPVKVAMAPAEPTKATPEPSLQAPPPKAAPEPPVKAAPEPAATAQPPAKIDPGPSGALALKATPVAAIFIDGKIVGVTPKSVSLDPGAHQLLLAAEGHGLWRGEVQAGSRLQVKLTPIALPAGVGGKAGLKVRCAKHHVYRILVDGHDSGENCPTKRLQVTPGRHRIEFLRFSDSARESQEVVVKPGHSSTRLYTKY